MKKYETFSDLDKATDFSAKAGFNMADKQIQAVEYLADLPRSANFSEVGCGKTAMATATSMLRAVDTTVVTVPPILIPQWEEWLNKVSYKVVRYQGTPKYRNNLDLTDARWIVMSHAILRQDFNDLYRKLHKVELEIIVDEAQAIKSSSSVLYKCVTKLGFGKSIQMLTGTPTTKPPDAYSYIKIKSPEMYRSMGHFENLHVESKDFFGQPTAYCKLDLLAERLALHTVKFTKEEVFGYNLQPIYIPLRYDLDHKHLRLYEKLVDEQLLLLDDGTKIDATTAQRLHHALQQIVCNWSHFSGNPDRSAAYDIFDEVVDETACLNKDRSKLIVWTYYKMTSRSMLAYANKRWPNTTVAAFSEADSAKSVELFMKDPSTRILIAQPGSAGVGLNPASVCSEMLFLEASTSPMQIRQACGRVDRMGQTKKPTIRFAEARGTIQKHLYNKLSQNDDLVQKVEMLRSSLRNALLGR